VSEGLFPDGAVGTRHLMTNWTPRASNRLGLPSAPGITAIVSEPGLLRLIFSATPGRSYRAEYKDSLDATAWTPVGEIGTASTPTLTFELNIGLEPQRFFRLRLE
jgi:hypothetical protein